MNLSLKSLLGIKIIFFGFLGTREMKKMNNATCASYNLFCQKLTKETKMTNRDVFKALFGLMKYSGAE
jgi:hypothetical protein